MYNAIIARVFTEPIEGADNIQQGYVGDYQVVVSKQVQNGDLGIFFPTDGCLSHEMAYHNSLYALNHGENANSEIHGFLESNRRVRVKRFMKVSSLGLWLPLSSLAWAGDISNLKEGDTLVELNGQVLCTKYFGNQQSIKAKAQNKLKAARKAAEKFEFAKHYDTENIRYTKPPSGSICYVTEKLHGASGRSIAVRTLVKQNSLVTQLLDYLKAAADYFGLNLEPKMETLHAYGSRNVNFYSPEPGNYRADSHLHFASKMYPDEEIFYELVGYDGFSLIQGPHKGPKGYPKVMNYTYGCKQGQSELYVYRITQKDPSGNIRELNYPEIVSRCAELDIKPVPLLKIMLYDSSSKEEFMKEIEALGNGPSVLCDQHIREGVCIMYETTNSLHQRKIKALKYKSFVFCHGEDHAKDEATYVDTEEQDYSEASI